MIESIHMKHAPTLVYKIRNSLYLNITSTCTADCFFCPRKTDPIVKGFDLTLWKDPTTDEIIREIKNPETYDEIVFCGFGEPTIQLDVLLQVARWLKEKKCRVRLNTNGHGNLIHKRDIVPELVGLIDEASISLNASNSKAYLEILKPTFGEKTFEEVIQFIQKCKRLLPKTTVTAVAYPGFDEKAFKNLAEVELGIPYRIRPYNELG
jgi:TatD DNase family protein